MHLQESGEMYLETIYILSKKSSSVRHRCLRIYELFQAKCQPCGRHSEAGRISENG